MTYRISTVADLTGIPRNTLLAWERRYGLVRPSRHPNGYRSYSDRDLALILRLKNAIAAGLRIGEAVGLLRKEDHDDSAPRIAADGAIDFRVAREELTQALVSYRRKDAEEILNRLVVVPYRVRLREVFFPVLRQVGDLWERGDITIAQEHYASALFRAHLAALLLTVGTDSPLARHAVTTTFVGDDHEIAALALAIDLGISGYRVSYLGPNLPASELAAFVAKFKPELVCISCIMRPSLKDFRCYVAELSAISGTHWVLGGAIHDVEVPSGISLFHDWAEFTP